MSGSTGIISKTMARFIAVQFMYKIHMTGDTAFSPSDVDEFVNTYAPKETNVKFFKRLVSNFSKDANLDEIIEISLGNSALISNAQPVEICIIKTALVEMIFEKTDIPVIINEYVEIAKDFLDAKSVKFINAVLDKIAQKVERKCLTQV